MSVYVAVAFVIITIAIMKMYFLNMSDIKYPGPPVKFLLGNFDILWRHPGRIRQSHTLWKKLADVYGGIYEFWMFGSSILVVTDPEAVHQVVTSKQFGDRPGRGFAYTAPLSLLGLHSTDDMWKAHRRLLAPLFTERSMRAYSSTISEECRELVNYWVGKEVDVRGDLMNFTADIIGLVGFGFRFDSLTSESARTATGASRAVAAEAFARALQPKFVADMDNKRHAAYKEARTYYENLVEKALAEYDPNSEAKNFVTVMKHAEMSEEEIKDEALGLLLAGHETTANTLSWFFDCLSKNPQYISQIQREVDEVMGERMQVTYEDIPNFKFLRQCINETLRLHNTIPDLPRICLEDTEVAGYPVRKGQILVAHLYTMSHNESVFHDAYTFRPERFAEGKDGASEVNSNTYLPFGGGQRVCLGRTFALQEMVIVAASIFRALEVQAGEHAKDNVRPEIAVAMGPVDEIYIKFTSRKTNTRMSLRGSGGAGM